MDSWNVQILSVLTTVHEGLAHHQGIIGSQTAMLQPLRNELTTLIQDETQAQRVAEIRSTIDNKVQAVWDSTNATQFLHQRIAVLTEQLEHNEVRQKLATEELDTTTQLIRASAKNEWPPRGLLAGHSQ